MYLIYLLVSFLLSSSKEKFSISLTLKLQVSSPEGPYIFILLIQWNFSLLTISPVLYHQNNLSWHLRSCSPEHVINLAQIDSYKNSQKKKVNVLLRKLHCISIMDLRLSKDMLKIPAFIPHICIEDSQHSGKCSRCCGVIDECDMLAPCPLRVYMLLGASSL